jgi:hypothetical protein
MYFRGNLIVNKGNVSPEKWSAGKCKYLELYNSQNQISFNLRCPIFLAQFLQTRRQTTYFYVLKKSKSCNSWTKEVFVKKKKWLTRYSIITRKNQLYIFFVDFLHLITSITSKGMIFLYVLNVFFFFLIWSIKSKLLFFIFFIITFFYWLLSPKKQNEWNATYQE